MSQTIVSDASGKINFPPITYKKQPVVTSEMLADAYGCSAKNIQMNFANNRERFTEGKHFYFLENGELQAFRDCTKSFGSVVPARTRNLTLWLERGAARHAKMLNTDRAWDVFEMLEETFFRVAKPEQPALPSTTTPSTASDRAPLRSLVSAWSKTSGLHFDALWPQVKAHFQLSRIDDLPVEWIPDALAFVQGKIDGLPKALPEEKPKGNAILACTPKWYQMQLESIWNSFDERAYEFSRWMMAVHNELGRVTGPLYKDVLYKLTKGNHHRETLSLDLPIASMHRFDIEAIEQARDSICSMYDAINLARKYARMLEM